MALRQQHAGIVIVSRRRSSRLACQAFGILALLTLWAFEGPAASLPPSGHRRPSIERSGAERGVGNEHRRLPSPPPIERGVGSRQLSQPPPVELGVRKRQLPSPTPIERGVGSRQLSQPPPVEPGVRKRQLPSPPPIRRGTPKGELPASDSIAVLIDGDCGSVQSVAEFLAEIRPHGRVVQKLFFAEPRRLENKKWKSFLASEDIEFVRVSRSTRPSRDPNDDAIYSEARKLLQESRIGAVALMANDKDYVPLVEEIVGTGRRCFVKIPAGRPGMARSFKRAGAQVFAQDPPAPKYICVLHSDGTGGFKAASEIPPVICGEEFNQAMLRLDALGYRSGSHAVPAVSKFWFNNGLGNLIVYPFHFAMESLVDVFRERPTTKWVPSCQGLAFIFPILRASPTRSVLEKYGSRQCARRVRAGIGPFILRDSPTMVEEMLRRLGFVDDDLNACFQEGLDVFASKTENARAMRKAGVSFSSCDTSCGKAEKIRRLCLSDSFTGIVGMPHNDGVVRRCLLARGLLKTENAPRGDVFLKMASFLDVAGLVPWKTYNGRVLQCLNVFSSRENDPKRRQ